MIPFKTGLDISVKGGITYIISHNFAKIKVHSYDSLPLEKTMTFCNVIILIKSVWNKDKNSYYYNIYIYIYIYIFFFLKRLI